MGKRGKVQRETAKMYKQIVQECAMKNATRIRAKNVKYILESFSKTENTMTSIILEVGTKVLEKKRKNSLRKRVYPKITNK